MKNLYIFLLVIAALNVANAQWVSQNSGTTNNLNSVYFTDANTGYAVGDSGTILKTTDGGIDWITQMMWNFKSLHSVYFTDAVTGYVVGEKKYDTACILKTTNGGTTWSIIYSYRKMIGSYLTSVYFPDANTGFAVGKSRANSGGTVPFLLKTINAGANWTVNESLPGYSLSSIYFTSADTGYAVGTDMDWIILKTTDGGIVWTSTNSGVPWHFGSLSSVYFTDSDTGYAVGSYGTILKTTDSGITWDSISSGTEDVLSSVYFLDANIGFAVGEKGEIIKTIDSGTTWNFLTSGTNKQLNSVYFIDDEMGYVVGDNGTILKTINGGGYPVGFSNQSPTSNSLKIYPNPTTDKITIETSAKGHLSILNLNGQELINRQITEPKTNLDISKLPSGVYFVRLTGERTVEVGKIIKW